MKITTFVLSILIILGLSIGVVSADGILSIGEKFDTGIINNLRSVDSIRVSDGGYWDGDFLIFEKYKSYDSSEREILIENIINVDLFRAKLLTDYNQHVGVGEDIKVAEFLLEDWGDDSDTFVDKLDFYDVKDGYKSIPRNYEFKYATDSLKEYCWNEETIDNKTNETIIGKEICENQTITTWIPFTTFKELPNKNIRVGLFTDTILGEKIEWIPTIKGFESREWASYLVDGLVAYYKLDETSGTNAFNSVGGVNGTASSTRVFGSATSGIINNSANFTIAGTDYINTSSDFGIGGTKYATFNMWIKPKDLTAVGYFFSRVTLGYKEHFVWETDGRIYFVIYNGTFYGNTNPTTSSVNTTSWSMVTFVMNGTNWKLYFNGVNETSVTLDVAFSSGVGSWQIGAEHETAHYINGTADEVGIWSRTLNATEILELYNDGVGFSYPFELPDETPPIISVISPINITYPISTIWFNATADEEVDSWIVNYNGTNVTLSDINESLEVADGNYQLLLYANDTSGNWGLNDSIYFSVDTEGAFVSTWKTNNSGTSNSTQITLPLEATGTYDFMVYWGDGKSDHITAYNDEAVTHNYNSAGTYEVTIGGTIVGFRFVDGGDKLKLLEISNWGDLNLGSNNAHFYGCENLQITATDILNLTGTTSMWSSFRNTNITSVPNMNDWDMSGVTIIQYMFSESILFNQNISAWDVSSVTTMGSAFRDSISFNQNIGDWDVSSVTNMYAMFDNATSFNQNISAWDMSGVTITQYMFRDSISFNQNIGDWDVSSVTNMYAMFNNATSFNQNLSEWNVSSVETMEGMFSGVTLSMDNYDSLLDGWASLPTLQSNVTFSGGDSTYCAGRNSRDNILMGIYNWTITDGGVDGSCDITPPIISVISPTNTTYPFSTIWFNATADEEIDTWIVNYNGTNVTLSDINESLEVADGSYQLLLYANDTSGNWGLNDSIYFSVDTTPPTFTIIPDNASLEYGNNLGVTFVGEDETEFDSYFINWTDTFEINSTGYLTNSVTLGVGVYEINVSINDTAGNVNSTIYKVTITQNTGACDVLFNESSPLSYPATFEVYSNCNSDFVLYRNEVEILNNSVQTLGADTYNFSVQRTDALNYSNVYDDEDFVIDKNDGSCDVLFNETSPIEWGNSFEAYSNCNSDFVLYRNGSVITNNSVQTLDVGSWNFTAERDDAINYLNIADTEIFVVEDTTPPIISVISPINITYPISTIWFNATADEEVDSWIVNYNGTNVTLSDINESLEVADGNYQLLLYANDTSGNWGLNDSIYFSVDTTPPTSPNVYSPTAQIYNGIISINYTASESSWGMSYYNISLMFENTFNKTIVENNSLDLGYSWDSTEIPYGNYTIRVEAVDVNGLGGYGYSEEFKIFAENFVSTWKTDNAGTSNSTQITLPLEASGTYNFMVYWGDGKSDHITAYDDEAVTHNYDIAGTYEVTIGGTIVGFRFVNGGDKLKILEISNWDNLNLGNLGGYFFGCENLQIFSTDVLNLTGTTNMESAFGYTDISTIPNIKDWDVSGVTNMNYMFAQAPFDQNLSRWDVSGVTTMEGMFEGVTLSQENYDSLLDGWASLPTLQFDVIFNAGDSVYCEGEDSRNNTLIGIYNWTITDGGINESCVYHEEEEEIPSQYIQGEGQIYSVMNTAGAGLGKFMIYMGNSLPILVIILVMVGIIVAVGYSIARVISGSIGRKK